MCSFSCVVCSIGLARVSAIFARSSRVSVSIVVFVSGGFCVVFAISSLYGSMSFLMRFSARLKLDTQQLRCNVINKLLDPFNAVSGKAKSRD